MDENKQTENFNNTNQIYFSDKNNVKLYSDVFNESKTTNQICNNFLKEMDNGSLPNLSNDLEPQILIQEETNLGRKRGRKKKDSLIKGKHDKFSGDNLLQTVRRIIIEIVQIFINSTIHERYKNEPDYDIAKDKLMEMKQDQIVRSNIELNKNFLKETLEHIFSEDISSKFKKYNTAHNRNLIFKLLNDNNIERRQIFRNLFTKTFLECLEHIRGTKHINELEGINTFDKYKEKYKNDNDYLASLEHMIKVYEIIISNKKGRKT